MPLVVGMLLGIYFGAVIVGYLRVLGAFVGIVPLLVVALVIGPPVVYVVWSVTMGFLVCVIVWLIGGWARVWSIW
jgi:hypothetical protein